MDEKSKDRDDDKHAKRGTQRDNQTDTKINRLTKIDLKTQIYTENECLPICIDR